MNSKAQQMTLGKIISITLGVFVLMLLVFGFSNGWDNVWCDAFGCEPEFRITVEECWEGLPVCKYVKDSTVPCYDSRDNIINDLTCFHTVPVRHIGATVDECDKSGGIFVEGDVVCEDVEVESMPYNNESLVYSDYGLRIDWLEDNCRLSKIYDQVVSDGEGNLFNLIYQCGEYRIEVLL